MYQLTDYVQIISPIIYGGALIVSILQFSAMRKSMFSQSVQQTYSTTSQLLFNILNSKEYLEMSQESPVVSKYYSLVDNPQQYYIIIQSFDMLELIFRLHKTKIKKYFLKKYFINLYLIKINDWEVIFFFYLLTFEI